ncbi:unnamed protein product [Lactuca virosa]|uniref:Uncharacterized protein n=1 Tax=Lactuca virosa TaxID=75947 RepID=A0AAU9P1B0_9ASTR|nr:unnamed protein product [Lactuca virosa]
MCNVKWCYHRLGLSASGSFPASLSNIFPFQLHPLMWFRRLDCDKQSVRRLGCDKQSGSAAPARTIRPGLTTNYRRCFDVDFVIRWSDADGFKIDFILRCLHLSAGTNRYTKGVYSEVLLNTKSKFGISVNKILGSFSVSQNRVLMFL